MTKNESILFGGIPAAFTSETGCNVPGWERGIPSKSCGIRTASHIVRTADGRLLMSMDAYAADGKTCGQSTCENCVFFSSVDDGHHWSYASRLDQSERMPRWAGPCEPTIATLADGRMITVFRLGGEQALWMAFSGTHGQSWEEAMPMKGVGGHKPY
eukprot:SAG31_NODE_24016_length_491_cov_0.732143_1_plen_156_part_10